MIIENNFNKKLIEKKKNPDPTEFNSSEFHPDHFGLGKVTELVLEEISDEQDHLEMFFTIMFFIGSLLIPLLLILSDKIQFYEITLIKFIQISIIEADQSLAQIGRIVGYILNLFSSIGFIYSATIMYYLAVDPGIGFKLSITAGLSTYIIFFLKCIIHDGRPYWMSESIKPKYCKITYGCPSLDVFSGFMYFNYMNYCANRAVQANDLIINKNKNYILTAKYVVDILVVINYAVGIQLFINGEHFLYQILITFFFGFILIRIFIIFNKNIDYIVNGSRYIRSISNISNIMTFFVIISLSAFCCIVYSFVSPDLQISTEWTKKINVNININIICTLRFIALTILTKPFLLKLHFFIQQIFSTY